MAVAEITKTESTPKKDRSEGGSPDAGKPGKPGWLEEAKGWGPRKYRDLVTFLVEVRAELKKVTWPSRNEVYSTTIITIFTTVFFGFYLWGIDMVYTKLLTRILR
jgi:preprotein translocase subunit SecE